jgi:hypothetical protein
LRGGDAGLGDFDLAAARDDLSVGLSHLASDLIEDAYLAPAGLHGELKAIWRVGIIRVLLTEF